MSSVPLPVPPTVMHWAQCAQDLMTSSTNYIIPMAWELEAERMLGVSLSQLRFALALLTSVAAGVFIRFVPTTTLRHMYSLLVGLCLIYYPFGQNISNLVPPAVVTYAAMVLYRRRCGVIAWAFTFPYLIVLHVLAASGLSWSAGNIDFTGGMMVAVLKIISVAVCYQDHPELARKKQEDASKEPLNSYQVEHALAQLPSPLEYAAYLLGFGNLLCGPFIEFKDYKDFIEHTGRWSPSAAPRPVPPPWSCGLRLLGESVLFIMAYLFFESYWSPALSRTPWFMTRNLMERVLILYSLGVVYQLRFYFAWKLSESSLTFAGLNFDEWREDGTPIWGRCRNCDFLAVQLSDSARLSVASWNIQTGRFLRRYVYERLARKPGFVELMITQLVSGVWHGLYPGYFLCFATSAIWLHNSTLLYKWQLAYLPPAMSRGWLVRGLKIFWTNLFLNYLGQAFIVLTFVDTFKLWRSVYFLPHVISFLMAVISMVLPKRRASRRPKTE